MTRDQIIEFGPGSRKRSGLATSPFEGILRHVRLGTKYRWRSLIFIVVKNGIVINKTGLYLALSEVAGALIKITYKDFHRDMFDQQVKKADMRAGFTENARNMNSYGPRDADPLSHEELPSLGVFGFSEAPPDFIPGAGTVPLCLLWAAPAMFSCANAATATLRTADAGNGAKRWQNLWTS